MSLAQALATAVSGMRTTQTGLALVAGNVANAETPGYVRKTLTQVTTGSGDAGLGVRVSGINRVLDKYLQAQLRTETAGGSYASVRSSYFQRLQTIYGPPGAAGGIEATYNQFTTALQSLSTSPDDSAARTNVLSAAQGLAQQLNQMTSDIQGLRSDAEQGLADSVTSANQDINQIVSLNRQIAANGSNDAATATLMDQRDQAIDQLSQLMDIRVVQGDGNQVSVFTTSGAQLAGSEAAQLNFTPQGSVTANQQWNADPTKSTLSSVTLTMPGGGTIDLVASKAIRSGQIAAYLEARDQTLVAAQSQLDGLAAGMASALSDQSIDGTAVTSGPRAGFDVNTANLSDGNTVAFSYTDTATGAVHHVTLMQVSDPNALPLDPTATADPNDTVIGVDFSQGLASVVTQLNSQFNGHIQFSNPSGTTLRILDDGTANTTDIASATATVTATSLAGGTAELPFFTDGNQAFSGAITANGSETTGFAGRITVNAGLIADPSRLVAYQAGVAAGDETRPDFLFNQMTQAPVDFSPTAGIGTAASPFSGSLPAYLQQMLSQQGSAADAAAQLQQGQDVVVNALQQRASDDSGVNIDNEMAQLLQLQNAYAANARVLSTVKAVLDDLMNL
jgi:flagellar hook-associated protein 1 FlgK